MAFLVTHILFGGLLGLAMRLPVSYVPVAMLLAELPDIDHLPLPGFVTRATFHNVFFCALLPTILAAGLARTRVRASSFWPVVVAAPFLLSSHLVLDLLPQPSEEVASASAALFYPFSAERYTLRPMSGYGGDPTSASTFALLAGALLALALGGLAVQRWSRGSRPRDLWTLGALAAAVLLSGPIALASGLVVPAQEAPDATFDITDVQVSPARGEITARVVKVSGVDAAPFTLKLVAESGNLSASLTNRVWITTNSQWQPRISLGGPVSDVTVRLVSAKGDVVYATRTAR